MKEVRMEFSTAGEGESNLFKAVDSNLMRFSKPSLYKRLFCASGGILEILCVIVVVLRSLVITNYIRGKLNVLQKQESKTFKCTEQGRI